MGTNSDGCVSLTARHGCKCLPGDTITVEDCLVAIGSEVGVRNIVSASRMNKAVVVFLKEVSFVQHLVEFGLTIRDTFLPVLPISNPSKKVILSNVPPFITNESLERLLARYGKLVAPIKMIPLGLKNPELKHVLSFRRQTFMILNAEIQSLNTSAKTNLMGKDYTIYISSESMRCFTCGKYGHTKLSCPDNVEADNNNVTGPNASVEQQPLVLTTNESDCNDGDRIDQNAEAPSTSTVEESVSDHVTSKHVDDSNPMTENTDMNVVRVIQSEEGIRGIETDEISESNRPVDGAEIAEPGGESVDSQASGLCLSQSEEGLMMEGSEAQSMDSESELSDIAESQERPAVNDQSFKSKRYYTIKMLRWWSSGTFNQRKPKLEKYFPDLKLFLESCATVMRKATLEELDQLKRYRIKKYMSLVKRKIKHMSKE
ncbi:Transposon TX1 uncharacterized 82 kDa protein ORF 1 [Triplophysa tibetana]|uniref:Transposon TX1 uncharacterized 82 kDa protein ORF 1 n=1 Tax=Triplophysa tibetana TaxID=1572043 RepID=A0A5A9NUY2_9TELE|nr:Transposon TX1 uncharacterized 82 kDa protein ORF 1 [Triplophysa tibetana]